MLRRSASSSQVIGVTTDSDHVDVELAATFSSDFSAIHPQLAQIYWQHAGNSSGSDGGLNNQINANILDNILATFYSR